MVGHIGKNAAGFVVDFLPSFSQGSYLQERNTLECLFTNVHSKRLRYIARVGARRRTTPRTWYTCNPNCSSIEIVYVRSDVPNFPQLTATFHHRRYAHIYALMMAHESVLQRALSDGEGHEDTSTKGTCGELGLMRIGVILDATSNE